MSKRESNIHPRMFWQWVVVMVIALMAECFAIVYGKYEGLTGTELVVLASVMGAVHI